MKDAIQKLKTFFQFTLWQEAMETGNKLHQAAVSILRVAFIMVRELSKGQLSLRAMSLVFTTLLSLVPLIAVAFSVLKAFGVHNQIEPVLLGFMQPLGERGVEITTNIIGFVENVKVGVLGSLGLALLFYTIIALIQKVESAFNYVWRVEQQRSIARRFTDYLSVLMIGPVLVFSALGISAGVMDNEIVQKLQSFEPFGTIIYLTTRLLPYLMIILAFTFLYTFIPNTKVKFGPAFTGATVAGVLWVSLGSLFASFVASSSNYTAIYSSFAILFFFMIWIYLAWFILLIGSQVAFYIQHPKLVQLGGKKQRLSPRLREKEGLWLMTVITRHFCKDVPPPTVSELEKETSLAAESVQELVTILEKSGLLIAVSTAAGCRYVPARDVANITVQEILESLRTSEEKTMLHTRSRAEPMVETLMIQLRQAQSDVLDNMTLRELALGKNQHE